MYIYPYAAGSKSVNELSEALGVKQIKLRMSKFKGSPEKTVINWGRTAISDEVAKCKVLNVPEAVSLASNKLKFFSAVREYNRNRIRQNRIEIPQFCTTQAEANEYLWAGYSMLARTVLNGHSGEGIVYCENPADIEKNPAQLYTLYIKKTSEYRVHVFNGKVIDKQRKARDRAIPDDKVDWRIRNHSNGFIYVRDEEAANLSQNAIKMCEKAVEMCGLVFGAVDLIYSKRNNSFFVLEVNTAPGLTGLTLEAYREAFKQFDNQG